MRIKLTSVVGDDQQKAPVTTAVFDDNYGNLELDRAGERRSSMEVLRW
jgi:hypothetical protein